MYKVFYIGREIITPQSLIKYGFSKDKDRESYFIDIENRLNKFDLMWYNGIIYLKSRYQEENLDIQALPHIKFLDQLKMLYFILSNKLLIEIEQLT